MALPILLDRTLVPEVPLDLISDPIICQDNREERS